MPLFFYSTLTISGSILFSALADQINAGFMAFADRVLQATGLAAPRREVVAQPLVDRELGLGRAARPRSAGRQQNDERSCQDECGEAVAVHVSLLSSALRVIGPVALAGSGSRRQFQACSAFPDAGRLEDVS